MTTESLRMKLKSSDNEVFNISREAAALSKTLNDMAVNLGLDDKDDHTIPLSNVSSDTLRRIIIWCECHKDYTEQTEEHNTKTFDENFFAIDQDTLFQVILAANYLDIKCLLDMSCKKVADMIKGKSSEQIRTIFNVEYDFTPEQEEEIRKEKAWCQD